MKDQGTARAERQHWEDEDFALEEEHAALLDVIDGDRQPVDVPVRLRRKVLALARERAETDISKNWIFGQIPRVILVTCILFAIAVIFISMR